MRLKFYIFSFLCHLLLLFAIYTKPEKIQKLDSKNVLVYLSELKVENNIPAPAPLQSLIHSEPKKEEKPKEKKIEKKIEKKVVKKIVKNEVKEKEEIVKDEAREDSKKEIATENSVPYNLLAGLVKDGTGTYIGDQKNGGGIRYRIKREIDPEYPTLAKRANYRNEVVIKTKFLIGLNGKVEEIIFLDNFSSYGFRKEVEKALKKWEFDPIIYQGEKIKLYFYKDFRFNIK